ncbi:MAG: fructose-6-phosphate aldolase [Candidatus Kerfeldbacteria bacterium]
MKIFIDSADVEEIRAAAETGMVDGVTTNPSLILKSGRKFSEVVKDIAMIVNGPISAEVTAEKANDMVKEAQPLLKIHKNITIKVPMTEEGIKACAKLRKQGAKVNVTLVFHANQALLAAKAGATFVSPFVGRLDDSGVDGMELVEEISLLYDMYGFDTAVLAASIRKTEHVRRAALAGADAATVPPDVFHELFNHKLTDAGMKKFSNDWKKVKQ